MEADEFAALLGQVGRLSPAQREALRQALSTTQPRASDLLDGRQTPEPRCAHCGSLQVGPWGQAHGLRRYRCRDCRRTFNALTGTSLARLRHKSAWLDFADALQQALSLRRAAATCGVATSTSFRWRHRFLAGPAADQPAQLSGIVEANETFFRRSHKGSRAWTQLDAPRPNRPARKRGAPTARRGTPLDEQVPVLIARDRQKTTADAILDGLSASAIARHLLPRLAPEVLLCTDMARAYAVITRDAAIRHEPINLAHGHVRDRVFHIQNVNAYDSRLKAWMRRFNGVATKYLHSYLGWRRMIERLGHAINPDAILLNCAQTKPPTPNAN